MHLEATSGRNLSGFVNDWFTGQGYPTYQLLVLKNGNNVNLTINQTSSHPSVSFFEMKVPVRFRAVGFDTTLIFQHESNGQQFQVQLPFSPTTINFDPEKWILAKNTVQIITPTLELSGNSLPIDAFPNPFSDFFFLENNSNRVLKIEVYDPFNKLTLSSHLDPKIQKSFEMKNLPSGFYKVVFHSGENTLVKKMIKL
jgi:hypothetical protein